MGARVWVPEVETRNSRNMGDGNGETAVMTTSDNDVVNGKQQEQVVARMETENRKKKQL